MNPPPRPTAPINEPEPIFRRYVRPSVSDDPGTTNKYTQPEPDFASYLLAVVTVGAAVLIALALVVNFIRSLVEPLE